MLKNWFYQRKKLKYKNTKTFYQKSAGLRLLQVWSNLKKKKFFAVDQKWQLLSSFIQACENGATNAKKWTLPKQKLKYINNKTFDQKSAGLRFLPVWYNLKKNTFDFDQKWQIISSLADKSQL
jgi:hypothetical protein